MVLINADREVQMLVQMLKMIENGDVRGWSAARAKSGSWTVTTTRRALRLSGSDTSWDHEKALDYIHRLRSAGLPVEVDLLRTETPKPKIAAPPVAEPELPVEAAAPVKAKAAAKPRAGTPAVVPAPVKVAPPAVVSSLPTVRAEDGEVTYELLLTPEMAMELRERPFEAITSDGRTIEQRPKTEDGVNFFVQLIYTKKYMVTHQGLAIGINGSVYDGQHRIEAVIRTGIPVQTKVTFNVHPDKIEAFDGGRARGIATKLKMAGVKHSSQTGAAARMLRSYLEWETAHDLGAGASEDGSEADSLVKPWKQWYTNKLNIFQIQAVLDEHPGLVDDMDWAAEHTKRGKSFTASAVGTFRYIAARAWPEGQDMLTAYCDAVVRAIGIDSPEHIANAVRDFGERGSTGGGSKAKTLHHNDEQLHVLLLGWNHFVKGKTRKNIVSGQLSQQFPVAYKPKVLKKP